jgi:hypothetical protein
MAALSLLLPLSRCLLLDHGIAIERIKPLTSSCGE